MRDIDIILMCCVAIGMVSFIDASVFRKDYTFNSKVGGWFKIHREPVTFNNAFLRCNAEGAMVASPVTDIMHSEMVYMLGEAKMQSCGIFTGIQATLAPGVFTSLEGVPLESIPAEWASGEPDNYQNEENCLLMTLNGSLADVNCNNTFPFMCFKKKTKSFNLSFCETVDLDYVFDSRTGSCYKFHKLGRSWTNAFMQCVSEGAHLAIINSNNEANVIKELFQRFPENSIDAHVKGAAAIGFYRKEEPKLWYTVHGETIEAAGYNTFGNGQPDNDVIAEGGSFCGAVFRDGKLDDVACRSFTLPYICEKRIFDTKDLP